MEVQGAAATSRQGTLIARTCILEDRALVDMAPVLDLAERSANAEPNNPTTITALGGALYRMGRLEEAVDVLEKALPLHAEPIRLATNRHDEIRVSQLSAAIFLMLAYRDLGKTDKLAAILDNIQRQVSELEELGNPSSARGVTPWSFRLAIELARRELAKVAVP